MQTAPPPLTEAQMETVAAALVRFVTAVYAEDAAARARIDAMIACAPGSGAKEADLPEAA